MLKSGTDFREMTLNKVTYTKKNNNRNSHSVDVNKIMMETKNISETEFITIIDKDHYKLIIETTLLRVTKELQEDEKVSKFIHQLNLKTEEKFKQVIGYLDSFVDARFTVVRNVSCPISNFVADLVRIYMNTDTCIINSGSLRMDSTINEGELTFGILKRLIPGEYNVVRIRAKGYQIWKSLENGVCKYPALEGRFPCVNLYFNFLGFGTRVYFRSY